MKKNYTHLVVLLDRSGSMTSIKKDIIPGFNEFIKKQKEAKGKCTVTLVQFDDQYEKVFDFADLNEFIELNDKNYTPRGSTALVDSMCKLIKETGFKLASMEEEDRPEKVLFLSITDGEENASKEFTNEELKSKIEHQESKYKWQFVYIGANQDAFANASKYGMNLNSTINFNATSKGIYAMFNATADASIRYRSADLGTDFSYSTKEQEEVKKAK
jgi:uncharacterized protein YegL